MCLKCYSAEQREANEPYFFLIKQKEIIVFCKFCRNIICKTNKDGDLIL